jgi:hypothetical protein
MLGCQLCLGAVSLLPLIYATATIGCFLAFSQKGIFNTFSCAHCLAFSLQPVRRATSSDVKNIFDFLKMTLKVLFNKTDCFIE